MGKSKGLHYRALSPVETREKLLLTQGFSDYWNHLKFDLEGTRDGSIKRLLDEAAEISVLIKTYLLSKAATAQQQQQQQKHTKGKLVVKLNPGGAREYLHNLESFPKDEKEFIAGIVKSTFAYSEGYVANLTEELLNGYVTDLLKSHSTKNVQASEDVRALEKETREAFNETARLAQDIFLAIEQDANTNPNYVKELRKMLNGITNVKNLVTRFHDALQSKIKDAASETSSVSDKEEEEQRLDQENEKMEVDEGPDLKGVEIKITNEEIKPPMAPGVNGAEAEKMGGEQTIEKEEKQAEDPEKSKNIQVVHKVANEVGEIEAGLLSLSNDVKVLDPTALVSNPADGKRLVDKLHQRCIGFSESLMKDLTLLDELTLSQEDRPKRKEQVKKIQSMANDVDNLLAKLHEMVELVKKEEDKQHQIEEEKKREKEREKEIKEKEREKEIKEKEREKEVKEKEKNREPKTMEELFANILQHQQKKTKNEMDIQEKKEDFQNMLAKQAERLEPYWRRMKLSPKMEVDEGMDRYVINSYIPGMNEDDINVASTVERGSPILTVKGHRSPSLEELAVMRRQLARSGIEADDETILKLGVGRFGTFVEKFAIPAHVDPQGIRAAYDSGELTIVLPKLRIRTLDSGLGRGGASPFGRGDFWW